MVGSNSLSNPSDVYQLSDIVIVSLKYIDSFLFNFQNTQHFWETLFNRQKIGKVTTTKFTSFKIWQKISNLLIDPQHEDYVDHRDHDIAILFVDGEVEADGVTVDFATLAETDAEDFVGSDCEIAGWGLDESKLRNIMNIQGRTYFLKRVKQSCTIF